MTIPDFSTISLEDLLNGSAIPSPEATFAKYQETREGIQRKKNYQKEDIPPAFAKNPLHHIPPGFAPYLRGPYPTMYVQRPWTIRQYAGFSTAKESNAFYLRNIKQGQRGLSIAFDLATHRGYDSDHHRVSGDVGMAGVAIDSIIDMRELFDQIPLDKMSVSMTMNGAVLPIMALYIVAAEEQGVKASSLTGTLQNDILKEFMVRNTYIYPPKESMRIVGDIFRYTAEHMPRFNPVSISGYHMQEAGATADLELAYTLANALEYVRCGIKAGMKVDDFVPRFSFFFGIGKDFFMEIAKLRAARLLWSHIMQDFAPKNPRSLMLRVHCQTSGWSLTSKDMHNNVFRTSLEALSAVYGHTQSLHTNSLDEAVALPTDFSAKIARDTQLLIQHETDALAPADPWGGSFYLERLTYDLAQRSLEHVKAVEKQGGMIQSLETYIPKMRIETEAAQTQALIDTGKQLILGVNHLLPQKQETIDFLQLNNQAIREEQIAKLKRLKEQRDENICQEKLHTITRVASSQNSLKENLLSCAIEAARAHATVGEISDALAKTFTRYEQRSPMVTGTYLSSSHQHQPDTIDHVRSRIEAFRLEHGRPPRILIAKLGQDGHDRGQKVVATAYADMGFDVDIGPLFQTPEEATKQAVDNDVHIIGISSLAAGHLTLVPSVITSLKKEKRDDIIVILGGVIPPDDIPVVKNMGVKEVFPPGTSIIDATIRVMDILEAHLSK